MSEVTFSVPGNPRGKGRPRVSVQGKFARAYTPEETIVYENLIKMSYAEQVGFVKLNAPIEARITGVFPIPQSVSRKKREAMIAGEILHTKKVDCDNLAKVVLDALNKIAFEDDSGVSRLIVNKVYGENPRVDVTLIEI